MRSREPKIQCETRPSPYSVALRQVPNLAAFETREGIIFVKGADLGGAELGEKLPSGERDTLSNDAQGLTLVIRANTLYRCFLADTTLVRVLKTELNIREFSPEATQSSRGA